MVVQWLRLLLPQTGLGLGSIPSQGTRSHVLQLRPSAAKSVNLKNKNKTCSLSGWSHCCE